LLRDTLEPRSLCKAGRERNGWISLTEQMEEEEEVVVVIPQKVDIIGRLGLAKRDTLDPLSVPWRLMF
jgi:hypothetical protein